ncbi:hypothetical protein [Pantoea sp. AS142]|uniref:hypothetical protein n=1 Tax=Pantoea sp. AS142 TaxID=3081292 RepID=UPI00301AEC70
MTLSGALPAIDADDVFASFNNAPINKSLYLFVFFYPGDYVVRKQGEIAGKLQHGLTLFISVISFVPLSCLNIFVPDPHSQALLSPLALLSVLFFVWIALKLKSELVCYIGLNSIVFYLSHYLEIQFFSKIVKFESPSAWVNDLKFISAFMMALAWTVCLMRKRGGFNFLLTMKKSSMPMTTKPV